MSFEEARPEIERAKATGTAFVQAGSHREAKAAYREALVMCQRARRGLEGASDGEAQAELARLEVALQSNTSLCCLKLEAWQEAVEAATAALALEPKHPKALFRRASGYRSLGRYQEAIHDLEGAPQEEAAVRNLLAALKKQAAKQVAQEKKAFGRMFQRQEGAGVPAPVAPAQGRAEEVDGGEQATVAGVPVRLEARGLTALADEARAFLDDETSDGSSLEVARAAMGRGMALCNRLREVRCIPRGHGFS